MISLFFLDIRGWLAGVIVDIGEIRLEDGI
jgi:hypothetical protein